jgi:UPF0755 protein
MKKLIILIVCIIIIAVLGIFFLPFTSFPSSSYNLYIRTGETSKEKVVNNLSIHSCIKNESIFIITGDLFKIWPKIKPGKYEIQKHQNLFQLIRMFRNNRQTPVNLVITKLRTSNQLAGLVGRKFECDSIQFFKYISGSEIKKKYNINSAEIFFITHPNTYTFYWSASPKEILKKIYNYHHQFWNDSRLAKASTLGLSPLEITTLASIVDEETLQVDEKSVIAGVYINRLKKGMPLGADPTIKFATGNFALKRILQKHIKETANSPYNTYINKGLPPGPICTPMDETIDAVLNATKHDYLFFCAAPGYQGKHKFAKSDKEHLQNANAYQRWLNTEGIR